MNTFENKSNLRESLSSNSNLSKKKFTESVRSYVQKEKQSNYQSSIEESGQIKNMIAWNTLCYYLIAFYAGISSITDYAVSFYFKDELNIAPSKMSQLMSAITLPWSLKPLLGLLTDYFPIFGYKRKYYIIMCGFISISAWLCMAKFNPTLDETFMLLLSINICAAFSSVLGEAIVVELAKANSKLKNESEEEGGESAKEYVSLFMIFKYFGMLFASFMRGSLVDTMGIKYVFMVGSALPCLVLFAGLLMKDTKIEPSIRHTGSNGLTNSVAGLDPNNSDLLVSSSQQNHQIEEDSSTPSLTEFFAFIFQKKILIPISFIILFMSVPSYTDPFFYFLTNELKFTATSLGQVSFCSTLGTLMGIFVYKTYFKSSEFRSVLIFCTLMSFIFTFCAYILVLRLNLEYGINDFWLVLFSNSLLSMLGEIMLLPLLSLACVLCPKNMEGTIFSVFMSALNFGSVLSTLFGSFLTNYFSIDSHNFTNLSSLIFITNMASLLPLPVLLFINSKHFKH